MGDFCHILSGAVGEEGEDGREECAGCECQKNLKDGQNRGNGVRQGKQSVADIGMRCPAPLPCQRAAGMVVRLSSEEGAGCGCEVCSAAKVCSAWVVSVARVWMGLLIKLFGQYQSQG